MKLTEEQRKKLLGKRVSVFSNKFTYHNSIIVDINEDTVEVEDFEMKGVYHNALIDLSTISSISMETKKVK
jgi:hypothetical protein